MVYVLLFLFSLCVTNYFFNENRQIYYWIICIFYILVIGFRPAGIDRDYYTYLEHFYNYQNITFLEPTFKIIASITHSLFGSNYIFLFIIYAIFGVLIKFIAIQKLSNFIWGSLLIYLSCYFIVHEMTQIRAGVASACLLLSIKPLYERDRCCYFFIALCATLWHYSAIIMFILYFLPLKTSKTLWLLLPLLSLLLYALNIHLVLNVPIPILHEKLLVYQNLKDTDSIHNIIHVLNWMYLVKLIVFYCMGWKYDILTSKNKYFILLFRIYCLSLCLFPLLSDIPVLAYRLSELLGIVEIVLFPMLYFLFKPSVLSKALFIFFCLAQFSINIFHNRLIVF